MSRLIPDVIPRTNFTPNLGLTCRWDDGAAPYRLMRRHFREATLRPLSWGIIESALRSADIHSLPCVVKPASDFHACLELIGAGVGRQVGGRGTISHVWFTTSTFYVAQRFMWRPPRGRT